MIAKSKLSAHELCATINLIINLNLKIMGAINFYNVNASRIYAFGMNKYVTQEDIDYNEWEDLEVDDFSEDLTRWSFEDTICNVIHELKSNGYATKLDKYYSESIENEIGRKTYYFEYCGLEISVTIYAQAYSGYYEGASFDWDAKCGIRFRLSYYRIEFDLTGRYALCEDDILYENPLENMGLSKIHAKRILNKIYEKLQEVSAELEEVFKKFCEHEYVCHGYIIETIR